TYALPLPCRHMSGRHMVDASPPMALSCSRHARQLAGDVLSPTRTPTGTFASVLMSPPPAGGAPSIPMTALTRLGRCAAAFMTLLVPVDQPRRMQGPSLSISA